MALISILLPFTNEQAWLKEAVSSIITQTYTVWELLLIGNRPDKDTLEIANSFLSDPRIKILNEDRRGISHALNTGLQEAGGRLIARMDADDICHPERLSMQMNCVLKSPLVDAVSCQTAIHPEGIPGEGFKAYMDWQNSIIGTRDHHLNRFIESPLAHPTVLFRKDLIDELGLYRTGELPEDYEMWLRWMHAGKRIYKLPVQLHYWRDHNERLSRANSSYSKDSFKAIRFEYLGLDLIKRNIKRDIILCGGKSIRKEAEALLQQTGVNIAGYSDVITTETKGKLFIPAREIGKFRKSCYYISIAGGRGKGMEMRKFFKSQNLEEEEDFIIAA